MRETVDRADGDGVPSSVRTLSWIAGGGLALALIGGYVTLWRLLDGVYTTGSPPIGLFHLIVFGAVGVVQVGRAAVMSDWWRRGTAVTVAVIYVPTIVSLGPGAFCKQSLPPRCGLVLDPFAPGLVVGFLLLMTALSLDLRVPIRDALERDSGHATRSRQD